MTPIKAAIISVSGTCLTDQEKELIRKENPFGVSLFDRNIETPQQLRRLTDEIKAVAERDNIIIAVDQEGGRVCRLRPPHFRSYLAQSAIGGLELSSAQQAAGLQAELIADDLQQVGINCNFAPTLDASTPLITKALKSRCFSRDPKVISKLGQIMMDSYQQHGIIPCLKHIPGHAGAENDPHLQLSVIPRILKRYLYPFEQLAPQALMAMTAHIVLSEIDSLPITMSKKAISELIRGHFGFKGLLVSDALEMKALSGSIEEKTLACRHAGCDVVCYCHGDIDNVRTVLEHCSYLSEQAMAVFEKISALIAQPYHADNISQKEKLYAQLSALAKPVIDDYDAVEVLNHL